MPKKTRGWHLIREQAELVLPEITDAFLVLYKQPLFFTLVCETLRKTFDINCGNWPLLDYYCFFLQCSEEDMLHSFLRTLSSGHYPLLSVMAMMALWNTNADLVKDAFYKRIISKSPFNSFTRRLKNTPPCRQCRRKNFGFHKTAGGHSIQP